MMPSPLMILQRTFFVRILCCRYLLQEYEFENMKSKRAPHALVLIELL